MAVEKELIHGIHSMLEGKEEGFNILYSYTYNYVYGRAKLFVKNEQDALDLTQETFIQAYKGIHTLEDVHNIYAWLGSIVYRQGMRTFRKKQELLVDEEAEGIFEDIVSEDKDLSPEESAEAEATSNVVMGMINELPELQRAAIMAFYYDNMKIDEIAEVFECSSNTIKSRLNYAKKTLKEKVEAHEKANRYRLHSLTPAVILLACKSLFAEKEYVLAAEKAQSLYHGVCRLLDIAPAAVTAGAAEETMAGTAEETIAGTVEGTAAGAAEKTAAGTAEETIAGTAEKTMAGTAEETMAGTAEETVAGSATGKSTKAGLAGAAADTAVKTGLGLGAKIALGVAAVLAVGAVAVGSMAATGNLPIGNAPVAAEDSRSENGQGAGTEETQENIPEKSTEQELTKERVLPTDRAWIDDLRDKLVSSDVEGLLEILTNDEIVTMAEPYKIGIDEMDDGTRFYYVLICSDGSLLGLSIWEYTGTNTAGKYSKDVFYGTKEENGYGFDYTELGDREFHVGYKYTGELTYTLFDGRYVNHSNGHVYDIMDNEYGVYQYGSGFESMGSGDVFRAIENWVY